MVTLEGNFISGVSKTRGFRFYVDWIFFFFFFSFLGKRVYKVVFVLALTTVRILDFGQSSISVYYSNFSQHIFPPPLTLSFAYLSVLAIDIDDFSFGA